MVLVCRQLQDARLRDQQLTDSVDQLITELISESSHQSNSDNIVQVDDVVTHSSVQSDCQQSEMTAHLFNYDSYPVHKYVVSSGGETSFQSEEEQCSPSLISCAEEEPNCQPMQKSSVEQGVTNDKQICLQEQCVFIGNVKQKGDNRDGALLSRKNMQQDFLAGNTVNGNCVQEMAEEISETYTEFADHVATGSNAWSYTSTQSSGNQDTNAVHIMEYVGDAEMNEVEPFSDIIPALTQSRDTGMPNYHAEETLDTADVSSEASTVVINSHDSVSADVSSDASTVIINGHDSVSADVSSDASTVIINGHDSVSAHVSSDASTVIINSQDSVSRRVQSSCEDGGTSNSKAVACSDEDEEMECHSTGLHSNNFGCKQKFASG